jgi:hypothetical protein
MGEAVGEPDIEDDLVWWVLVGGNVFMLNPEERIEDALVTYEKVLRMARRLRPDEDARRHVSLVRVGRRWGWANYVGS